jgi:two-component system response regulator
MQTQTSKPQGGSVNPSGDVLLVEDNKADIQLTLHVLSEESAGYQVHVLRDGEEALNFLLGQGPYANAPKPVFALVLLDLKLPKVNGLEVLKEIKNNSSTKALPVVVLSSSNQVQDVDTSYQLGANGYVQKPVGFEEFSDAIRRIAEYWLQVNLAPSPAPFKGANGPGELNPGGNNETQNHKKRTE